MDLVHLTMWITAAILGISLTDAARLPTPKTETTISQQRTSLPFKTSQESFNKAQELGARFPPGYDVHHPYIYHVQYSSIILHCHFEYTPTFNTAQTDAVFRRIFTLYTNPLYRDRPLSVGLPRTIDWREGTDHDATTLLFEVPLSVRDGEPWPISRGDFLNVAIGVNRLRLDYPMLTIGCEAWQEGRFSEGALGGVLLASGVR
ncbi:MAG: hypothetical protein LQ337_004715 [Flavoplaca oasis]|nr:MAG: hypothetical protein LQ337_004715 [Flavoplaca oasis]